MKDRNATKAMVLIGLLVATAFGGVGSWNLMQNLRTLSLDENNLTIWATGGPFFMLWAFSVTLGSVLAGVGALLYVRTRPVIAWLTGGGILAAAVMMVTLWSRVYNSVLFGIGGMIILLSFFAVIWIWMKKNKGLDSPAPIARSCKLIGYVFWVNASWFLCGETGKMHLKAFEGSPQPSPIEIMVFLMLGWIFVLIGEAAELRHTKRS